MRPSFGVPGFFPYLFRICRSRENYTLTRIGDTTGSITFPCKGRLRSSPISLFRKGPGVIKSNKTDNPYYSSLNFICSTVVFTRKGKDNKRLE